MKRLLAVFIIAVLSTTSFALHAQEANDEGDVRQQAEAKTDKENKTANEGETDADEKKDLEGQANASNSGEFVPSEEISEDVPVSFPVDI